MLICFENAENANLFKDFGACNYILRFTPTSRKHIFKEIVQKKN